MKEEKETGFSIYIPFWIIILLFFMVDKCHAQQIEYLNKNVIDYGTRHYFEYYQSFKPPKIVKNISTHRWAIGIAQDNGQWWYMGESAGVWSALAPAGWETEYKDSAEAWKVWHQHIDPIKHVLDSFNAIDRRRFDSFQLRHTYITPKRKK